MSPEVLGRLGSPPPGEGRPRVLLPSREGGNAASQIFLGAPVSQGNQHRSRLKGSQVPLDLKNNLGSGRRASPRKSPQSATTLNPAWESLSP